MVNKQLAWWIAKTFLIRIVTKLDFLYLSSGAAVGTGRAAVTEGSKRLRGSKTQPQPTARALTSWRFLPPKERPVYRRWSLQVWVQETPLKNLSPHVISSHPFEQCQKQPSFAPFPDLWPVFPSFLPLPEKGVTCSLSLQMPVFLACIAVLRSPGPVSPSLKRHCKRFTGAGTVKSWETWDGHWSAWCQSASSWEIELS